MLTLTYLTSRSNLVLNAFKWNFFEKVPHAFKWDFFFLKDDLLKTVKAKVIIITRYLQPNETITIDKF